MKLLELIERNRNTWPVITKMVGDAELPTIVISKTLNIFERLIRLNVNPGLFNIWEDNISMEWWMQDEEKTCYRILIDKDSAQLMVSYRKRPSVFEDIVV